MQFLKKAAQDYLRPRVQHWFYEDAIRHTGNFEDFTWFGVRYWQAPWDAWLIQEAIYEVKPALIVETGTNQGGSAFFYASLFDLMGQGRIITVDIEKMHDVSHSRIEFLIGSSVEESIFTQMKAAAEQADGPVMVILDSHHSQEHVARELELYSPLVSKGSLLLCQDGIIDELPMLSVDRPGPLKAIDNFLKTHREFQIDEARCNKFPLSHHPRGWLKRVD